MWFIRCMSGVVLLSALGCQSSQREKPFLDGEHQPVKIDTEENAEDILPSSLWSPVRRRVNASFYYLAGEQEYLRNNPGKARELFEAAYNLDPNAVLAGRMIAAEANSGQLDEALLQAKKVVLLYPKSAEIHSLYAQLLAGKGVHEKARHHYRRAITIEPKRLESYLGLIELHRARNEIKQAIAVAKDMLKADPDFGDGWAILAKLHLAAGQKKEVLNPAQRAYDLQSNDPEKILIYALALELNGNSKKAMSLYEILFRANPGNEDLIARMVELYRQFGSLEDALALLDDAANEEKASVGIKMQRAFILWELKRYKEAAQLLTELARKYPDSDRLQYMAALGHERLEQSDEALRIYEAMPHDSQFYVHAEFRAIAILREKKRYEEALQRVEKVISTKVERSQEFFGVGAAIYADQNRYNESVAFVQRGLKEHPRNVSLTFLLGVYEEKAGHKDKCIAAMREVMTLDPKHSSAMNYLGYLYAEAGENLDEAESLVKRALELKPDDGFYKDSLAWVYYQKRDYKKALSLLEEALRIVPDEGVILEHLADVHLAIGNKDKALEFYAKALASRLENRDKSRIEAKRKKLNDAS